MIGKKSNIMYEVRTGDNNDLTVLFFISTHN